MPLCFVDGAFSDSYPVPTLFDCLVAFYKCVLMWKSHPCTDVHTDILLSHPSQNFELEKKEENSEANEDGLTAESPELV